jgi:PAS domain S-box-containing protein
MIGYTREELLSGSIDWIKMTPPEDLEKDARALEELKKTGYCTAYEKQYILRDGSRVPFLIGAAMLNLSPLEWLCFVVDLRDLKRVEAELRRTHEELEQKVAERTRELAQTISSLQSEMQTRRTTEQQLRELSARLLRLQDEERRRIARDLHDSTGQTLTALKMTAASLQRFVAGVPQASKLVDDLNARADEALQEIRSMSHLLHPPLLDEVGFASAARWYVDGFAKRSGIRSSLDLASAPQLNKEEELVFFRVLQESLTNVLRHSGSNAVDIKLTSDGTNGVLSIKDYGKGIASEKLEVFRRTGAGVGVALGGMKQRLRELGGHLKLESERTGTCVIATLPLPQAGNTTARKSVNYDVS